MSAPFVQYAMFRHRYNTDIELQILKIEYRAEDYVRARVLYWRRDFGCGGYLLDPMPETVKFRRAEWNNWSLAT